MVESRSTPQDRRQVRSHGEQPTRSQVDWAIRLTRSQVLYEEQPTRSQAATWRKLRSYASSAINQLTLFGVHPQNQTQTLTVDVEMARYSWGAAMHQEKFNSAVIVPHACSRSGDGSSRLVGGRPRPLLPQHT